MKKKKKVSARSKRADQKRISIAEIKKNPALVLRLKQTARFLDEGIGRYLKVDFAGTRGLTRFKFTAKCAGMTPLEYFIKKIAPKL